MRALLAGLVLLASGCQTALPGEPAASVTPIRSVSNLDASELGALANRLSGVRIVQLGESSHGAAEFSVVKAQLVRFLHEELGFNVLAFESDIYQCARADAQASTASARETLASCTYGVWHTEEVLALFEYVRQTRASDHPLIIAGYDIQPIGPNKEGRPDYLADVVAVVDPSYAESIRANDQAFLDVYARGSRERRAYFRANRDQLIQTYSALYDFLVRHETTLIYAYRESSEPLAPLFAQQTAWAVRQYVVQQTAPSDLEYAELRDFGMAQTLTFLATRVYPNERIITWAHNSHVQYRAESIDLAGIAEPNLASRSAGSWLRETFGADLVTIGVYGASGSMARNDRSILPVSPIQPRSLEAAEIPPGAQAVLLLAPQNGARHPLWNELRSAKYWGAADIPMVLAEQYDGVVLVREVRPPAYLN